MGVENFDDEDDFDDEEDNDDEEATQSAVIIEGDKEIVASTQEVDGSNEEDVPSIDNYASVVFDTLLESSSFPPLPSSVSNSNKQKKTSSGKRLVL